MDLVKAISTNAKESLLEEWVRKCLRKITKSDSFNSLEFKDFFIIFADNKKYFTKKTLY